MVSDFASAADYPPAGSESTEQGRAVWIANCEGCHAYGIAGSPNPMSSSDWVDRVGKPRSVLYEHAINGFFGPDDTQMPPRGGNDQLHDIEVKEAVDYMLQLVNHTLKTQEK